MPANLYRMERVGLLQRGLKSVHSGGVEYIRAEHGESRYSVKLLPGVVRKGGLIVEAAPHLERIRDDAHVIQFGPRRKWQGAILAFPFAELFFWQPPYAEGLSFWPGAELQGRVGVESCAYIPEEMRKLPHVNILIFSGRGATCFVFDQKKVAVEVTHQGHGILISRFVEVEDLLDEIIRLILLFGSRRALNFVRHNLDRLEAAGHEVGRARGVLRRREKAIGS